MLKPLLVVLLSTLTLMAEDVDSIIKKMEHNTRATNVQQSISMEIQTSRGMRTMKMTSWSEGNEKSFIRLDHPKQNKGITFLKRDKQMWQYIPRIEKTIKIPASMMMQSWMGTDFSNDDMVKESSMVDDYDAKLLSEDGSEYTIELMPHEDAAVVWGKVIVKVDKKTYAPLAMDYFDEDGVLERSMYFKDIKKIGDLYYPTTMIMQPQEEGKQKNITTIKMHDIDLNPKIDANMFTKRALKRYSR